MGRGAPIVAHTDPSSMRSQLMQAMLIVEALEDIRRSGLIPTLVELDVFGVEFLDGKLISITKHGSRIRVFPEAVDEILYERIIPWEERALKNAPGRFHCGGFAKAITLRLMIYQSDDRAYRIPHGPDSEDISDLLERLLLEAKRRGENVLLVEVDWRYNMYFLGKIVGKTVYDRYRYHPDDLVNPITQTFFTP